MSQDIPYHTILQIVGIIWPLINLVLIAAAVLLFLADRRLHTICLIIGFSVHFLYGIWQLVGPMLILNQEGGQEAWLSTLAISSGISIIAHAMIAYGLITVGLIQYRKSKLPGFSSGE